MVKSGCGYTIFCQTTMCCRQWNNIKWSSSLNWRTPRVSVKAIAIPIMHNYTWYKLWNSGFNSIMLCRWYSIPSRNKRWRGHTDATKWLHKLYKWADTNNKFKLLRYGNEQEIKSATTYRSYDDSNIDDKEQVRDLGIMMSNRATFTLHIRNIVKKAREKMEWVLRVFQSRKCSLMLTLLKSVVIPLLEYCCQIWNRWKANDIQSIEAIQETFTYKITKVEHLNYWERLHELKLNFEHEPKETPWTLYNYIYLNYNTAYTVAVCYSISNKQKPSTIP